MVLPTSARITIDSPEAMRAWGKAFARTLRPDDIVALIGPMGAGKTTLVQGIAVGWGASSHAVSPTFSLANEYKSKRGYLFHMDLYRLTKTELAAFPLEDYFGQGACVMEWADRIRRRWPRGVITLQLSYVGKNKRRLVLTR